MGSSASSPPQVQQEIDPNIQQPQVQPTIDPQNTNQPPNISTIVPDLACEKYYPY